MPIYEFACPKCRVIYNFLAKRVNPGRKPACPKCGSKKMRKQMSAFASPRNLPDAPPSPGPAGSEDGAMPDLEDPKMMRVMNELERDMEHLDENNPKHMAHVMKKMKDAMPPGTMPKELDIAIKRLESGEDPEKIEQDMGDVFGEALGGEEGPAGAGGGGHGGAYSRDGGLYDY